MYWILTVRGGKKNIHTSSNFYAAGGNVREKVEQGKKNNKCALAEGDKGQV